MKEISKWLLCAAMVAGAVATKVRAAQSEQTITFALSGFIQGKDSRENDKALPFRYTTKDVLTEIGFFEGGIDLTNGKLVLINSIDDTNVASRIVARKGTTEVDVTDLFVIDQGEEVHTSRYVSDVFRNATIYSVDSVQFQTLDLDTNGLALEMQTFSKESQHAVTKKIGIDRFSVVSSSLSFDGNGELFDQFGLLGPLKGKVKIGAPKFVATPTVILTAGSTTMQNVSMEIQRKQASSEQHLPPLPPQN
jgi:hypothetical protein